MIIAAFALLGVGVLLIQVAEWVVRIDTTRGPTLLVGSTFTLATVTALLCLVLAIHFGAAGFTALMW